MSSGWFKPLATVQSGCAETGPEGVAGTAEAARQGSLTVAAGDGVRAVAGLAVGPVEQAATRAATQAAARSFIVFLQHERKGHDGSDRPLGHRPGPTHSDA